MEPEASLPCIPEPVMSQMNPFLAFTPYLKIHLSDLISPHLRLGLLSILFPWGYPSNILFSFIISPCVLYVPPISYSSFYFQIILDIEYKFCRCSCSSLRPLIFVWFHRSKYSSQEDFLIHPQSTFFLWQTKFHAHVKQKIVLFSVLQVFARDTEMWNIPYWVIATISWDHSALWSWI
jgi:hypothetical protein